MKRLLLPLLAVVLSCAPASPQVADPIEGRPISAAVAQAALSEALRLMASRGVTPPPATWRASIMPVTLIREVRTVDDPNDPLLSPGQEGAYRLWAAYITHRRIGKRGKLKFSEQIEVYVLPDEDCLIPELLVHEFLHAIHERAMFMGYQRDVPPEVFVAHFHPYREEFPECPVIP